MAPPSTPALAELMRAYCAGDAMAFREMYRQVGPKIHGYLHRLSGDASVADDLLQATFLRVHRARGTYIQQSDPLPWLYAIAHRLFLDEVRRRRRQPVPLPEGDDGYLLIDASPGPRAALERQHEAQRAMHALNDLPQDQRQALILTKLEGHSMQQAADIAGTTLSAMKVRAHRGYLALRRTLDAMQTSPSHGNQGDER